ncbi:MAG: M48 family metalloprotease [Crocinitomicaceae bacterium]|nr:M48 family metallopeptidase [Flavobacteriales bacterium]NQZ35992.1 M48 family metalloprotease [Crocinitomicaceae bacterium]
MKSTYVFIFSIFFIADLVHSQTEFSNYSTLLSKGIIPDDFHNATYDKVEKELNSSDIEIESHKEKVEFLEKTRYAIDELLHSGDVVYGDEVSNYISSIADKLLADNDELRSELRFYTLKLNETNAFSTDQGIIFVTTGLLSRLKNEAQLAYILSHEIAHYTENHVIETFVWKKSQSKWRDWVKQMSVYSKNKEFDADRLAIDMYRKAGYSKDELLPTLDILLYSYLPFDQKLIDIEYFKTDKLFLPNSLFSDSVYAIEADAFSNDSLSSHPNIGKRKAAVKNRIKEIEYLWGTAVYFLGKEQFLEIRNIARFETVRTDVMEANYGKALYSIYLLEHEFSESLFLDRMKLLTWLGLYQYSIKGKLRLTVLPDKELEGESANVHYFLKNLDRRALKTLSFRYIYDIRIKYPNNSEIRAASSYFFKLLKADEEFNLDEYSTQTPYMLNDSLDKKSFYYFGLSDVLIDSAFIEEFNRIEILSNENNISDQYKSRYEYQKNKPYDDLKIGSDNLIVIEPRIFDYDRRGRKFVKSEKLEKVLSECISSSGELAGVEIHQINKRNLTTESFNSRSALYGFLDQLNRTERIDPFPVDYQLINAISERFGTPQVMFMAVDHTYKPNINVALLFLSALTQYTFPIYLPLKLFYGNQTNLNIILMDIETGELLASNTYRFHESLNKHNIGSRLFNLFMHVKIPQSSNYE